MEVFLGRQCDGTAVEMRKTTHEKDLSTKTRLKEAEDSLVL